MAHVNWSLAPSPDRTQLIEAISEAAETFRFEVRLWPNNGRLRVRVSSDTHTQQEIADFLATFGLLIDDPIPRLPPRLNRGLSTRSE